MLTRFLKNSKPLNFFISALIIAGFYSIYNFTGKNASPDSTYILKKIGILIIFWILLLLINFVLFKNKSFGRHSYVLYLFTLFCISSPTVLTDNSVIMAGFFSLLGLKRVISLQTRRQIQRKIFDSFFFFSVAALVFPEAIILMFIPFYAILIHAPESLKNWLLPFPAILSVLILKTVYSLATQDVLFNPASFFPLKVISPEKFSQLEFVLPLILFSLFIIFALFNIFSDSAKESRGERKTKILFALSFICSLGVIALAGNLAEKSQAQLLFLFIPAAVIGGSWYEIQKQGLLKEILLIVLGVSCITMAILFM